MLRDDIRDKSSAETFCDFLGDVVMLDVFVGAHTRLSPRSLNGRLILSLGGDLIGTLIRSFSFDRVVAARGAPTLSCVQRCRAQVSLYIPVTILANLTRKRSVGSWADPPTRSRQNFQKVPQRNIIFDLGGCRRSDRSG